MDRKQRKAQLARLKNPPIKTQKSEKAQAKELEKLEQQFKEEGKDDAE